MPDSTLALDAAAGHSWLSASTSWEGRLSFILDTMREMSRQRDPQQMVELYGARMRQILPTDGFISLSRRELPSPRYRITRSSRWTTRVNPWKERDRLPVFDRGLLGELIYGDTAVVIDELSVPDDDPAAEYLQGHRSLLAIPLFDEGHALNMVVRLNQRPGAFDRERLPEFAWMSNLFGIATRSVVLSGQVQEAYEAVDREMAAVADIQRSLLPAEVPQIPTLAFATHYQTSRRAGGDYYDFFALPDGQWGILIADVSGHGTPAAVLMAITHSIAHVCCHPPSPASTVLAAINRRLAQAYTMESGNFVTAFYGVYNPPTRTLTYANAGHPPPRVRRAGAERRIDSVDGQASLPLGIVDDEVYADGTVQLHPGDTLVLYTDGITEARDPQGPLFGTARLDAVLSAADGDAPRQLVRRILGAVEAFTGGVAPSDDRTLLVANVT